MGNDSIKKTLLVAFILCIVCSVVVSTAAVMLRPAQQLNKELDRKANILAAAGLLEEGVPVAQQFERVTTRAVSLETGRFTDTVDVDSYDQRKAGKDPALSENLSEEQDIAKIGRRENIALVYLVERDGKLDKVILPIRGYGLWSTLHGFIALESDLNTVAGLGFYEHGETPGLGGEVDNPLWRAKWKGKTLHDQQGDLVIRVIKGAVDETRPEAKYQIDGLSGATLTSRGVDNLVRFWLGEQGFGAFLNNLQAGEA